MPLINLSGTYIEPTGSSTDLQALPANPAVIFGDHQSVSGRGRNDVIDYIVLSSAADPIGSLHPSAIASGATVSFTFSPLTNFTNATFAIYSSDFSQTIFSTQTTTTNLAGTFHMPTQDVVFVVYGTPALGVQFDYSLDFDSVAPSQLPGSVAINDVSIVEGNSGTRFAVFTVTRTGGTAAFDVDYATGNATASQFFDYGSTTGRLSFAVGQMTATISVAVFGDTDAELDETFIVALQNATNGCVIVDALGQGTIVNDDVAVPVAGTISIGDASIAEGNSGTRLVTVTVTRTGGTAACSVNYATADSLAVPGSDYLSTSGVLDFAAGETTKLILITIIGDTVIEPDESFFVDLSNATNGATIADARGQVLILNDDSSYSIDDVRIAEGNSGSRIATFTVLRSGGTMAGSINYSTIGGTATSGSDFSSATGVLNFAAGETSKTVSISVLGDTAIEGDETFFVNLSGAAAGAIITDGQGQGTILNDDGPVTAGTIAINDVTGAEGNWFSLEGSTFGLRTFFQFTVTRSGGNAAFAVNYTTADGTAVVGSDYTLTSGVLNFAFGELSKTVSVLVAGGSSPEPDESFFVNLSGATNGASISDGQGVGTILNDDGGSNSDLRVTLLDVNTNTGIGNVSTTTTPGGAVVLHYTLHNTFATGKAPHLQFYVSTDPTIAPTDTPNADAPILGTVLLDNIPTNGTLTLSSIMHLPSTLGPGTYYVGVIVDFDGRIAESDELNNASAGFAITVNPAANLPPSISGPASIDRTFGQTISFIGLISGSDPDGSVAQYRFTDSTPGSDNGFLTLDGVRFIGSVLTVATADLARVGYNTGSIVGSNAITIEAIDNQGLASSSPLATTISVTAPSLFTEGADTVTLSTPGGTWHALGGQDNVAGTGGIDIIFGDAGNDTLNGMAGVDQLFGGDGDDFIVFDSNDVLANVLGGTGADTLLILGQSPPATFDLSDHEFELAIGDVSDPGGNIWSTVHTEYVDGWLRRLEIVTNDDTSYRTTNWDVANTLGGLHHYTDYFAAIAGHARTAQEAFNDGAGGMSYLARTAVFYGSGQANYIDDFNTLGIRTSQEYFRIDSTRQQTTVWDATGSLGSIDFYQDYFNGAGTRTSQTVYYDGRVAGDLNTDYQTTIWSDAAFSHGTQQGFDQGNPSVALFTIVF